MKRSGFTYRNRVRLLEGGAAYFSALQQLIERAQRVIYLQFYIFEQDETGHKVVNWLSEAAARGVSVYLMADGYASRGLSDTFRSDLKKAGIHFRWFEPLFRSRRFYFGRRMHHKLVVADGLMALAGGLNVCNRYDDRPGEAGWLDMAVSCEGEAAVELLKLCQTMWGEHPPVEVDRTALKQLLASIPVREQQAVRVRRNDWVMRRMEISKTYRNLFGHAREDVIILCSYFLPGRVLRRAIASAARRGVRIRAVLAGPSDVMMAKHAERYLYRWLLKNGVEIVEYQKTVLHAKVACCDGSLATVGSYNVNNISSYASLELNLELRQRGIVQALRDRIERIIREDCRPITAATLEERTGWWIRGWQRFCYHFINSVFNIVTFYYKQKE